MSPDMIDLNKILLGNLLHGFRFYHTFHFNRHSAGRNPTVTRKDHILRTSRLNTILGAIVNATRSTPPFITY